MASFGTCTTVQVSMIVTVRTVLDCFAYRLAMTASTFLRVWLYVRTGSPPCAYVPPESSVRNKRTGRADPYDSYRI